MFTRSDGRLACVAKGARRPKSRFGAALEPFALSEITWYWHQQKTIYTLTEATLVSSHSGIVSEPARFLAAEQLSEFLLRTSSEHDPNEKLWQLALTYLAEIETADDRLSALVLSFLLKGASFLGFRPELRYCLACGKPVENGLDWRFDPRRGGVICPDCGVARDVLLIAAEQLATMSRLLYQPANRLTPLPPGSEPTGLVRSFLAHHIAPLRLNSLNWSKL